ncbi:MAG TPA: hypothetical protein VMU28_13120 [Terriglobales bacterium]|nr:hypothetical protein [Terriglobales bacterium]
MNRIISLSRLAVICTLMVPAMLSAQDWKTNPRPLVRVAAENENKPPAKPMYFMHLDVKRNKNGQTETRETLQTPQLALARIIAIDGHPLSAEAKSKEDARLNRLVSSPDELAKKQKQQKLDDARARKMVEAIPDAFTFQYVTTEKTASGDLVVLKFSPDPAWNPPDRELQVFTGMQGTLKIAVPQNRIALMDATLFRGVDFGWGIFGHLNPGGSFLIEQKEVAPTYWDTTHMMLHFTGKILLIKSLDIQEDESTSDYRPVDGMSVGEALNKLKEFGEAYEKTANGGI